ncbi:small-conductance mechanosensitive channel [Cylindrospermum stagnale PCC 7417]|uniref:Small-conductance mechanosensitive channel n=1 Tax=Cylindrospermum stagnale PCC 7417 TaxID=56107 RepID=K9X540_9NOST|nr:mechanosensitive ion channel family protein [Cylindrospermum stagnale]AFZ26777.1 small-conductance mechanosensitive channel [Cylindrospermum stagnale PCC 7417]
MHSQILALSPQAAVKATQPTKRQVQTKHKLIWGTIGAIASSIFIAIAPIPKATAQIPFLSPLQAPSSVNNDSDNRIVSGWIYLDGRRLFQISASRTNFPERLQNIQQNLQEISHNYFQNPAKEIKIQTRTLKGLPVIYVNGRYLMTITSADAGQGQGNPLTLTNQITQTLQRDLQQAKQERQSQFLIQQGKIAAASALAMIILSWGISRWQHRTKKDSEGSIPPTPKNAKSITIQLNQQQKEHLHEVKKRLFQLAQTGIWGSGSFLILGLFPYTRAFQLGILTVAQIPLRLAVVAIGTYVGIRFTYALIDRFTSTLVSSGSLLTPETSERLQLRISTFSGVTKSIAAIIWVGVGILLALISLGIDIVPLLAGAGLVGVAVSLASQNLIKDAINGFLIILEDQYALGDIISVNTVGGLVETLNLRMTQVRDSEGRLITIPNSEIKTVANLSSRWSRADLKIPVSYQTDIDQALKLVETVGLEMDQDEQWQHQILETPRVLGVENFGEQGVIIRVWIKTQPLKQWEVAREYRRRLKIALDQAGISMPALQQAIYLNNDAQLLNFQANERAN